MRVLIASFFLPARCNDKVKDDEVARTCFMHERKEAREMRAARRVQVGKPKGALPSDCHLSAKLKPTCGDRGAA
jgi:hypothetical protein